MDSLAWLRTKRLELCTQGAHVTRAQLGNGEDLLFLSPRTRFAEGVPIRGGIPLVFPWFGDDPEGRGRPAHGFARRVPWRLVESAEDAASTRAVLELEDDDGTRALWPHRFRAQLEVRCGERLDLRFSIENRDAAPFRCEVLFHTYLRVRGVDACTVSGLSGARYRDKAKGGVLVTDEAPVVAFGGEVDRTYCGTTATCTVDDPGFRRRLVVTTQNARSTVVWSPGTEKAERLSDLGDAWRQFVCVESGNVDADTFVLAPGARHECAVGIGVEAR